MSWLKACFILIVSIMPHTTPPSLYQRFLSTFKKAARIRLRCGLLLRHDSAVPHKDRLTKSYLDEENIHLMENPPYSLHLTLCDFWLFPKIKPKLAGRPFWKIQEFAKAVHSGLRGIPASRPWAHLYPPPPGRFCGPYFFEPYYVPRYFQVVCKMGRCWVS